MAPWKQLPLRLAGCRGVFRAKFRVGVQVTDRLGPGPEAHWQSEVPVTVLVCFKFVTFAGPDSDRDSLSWSASDPTDE